MVKSSYLLDVGDILVARSAHGLLYRTLDGRFFVICECGDMLNFRATQEQAEQSWRDHWTTAPYCTT